MSNYNDKYEQQLQQCMLKDKFLLTNFNKKNKNNKKTKQESEKQFQSRLDSSIAQAISRRKSIPDIQFPEELPIISKLSEIKKSILENQVIVLSGETGSGKTTQLPKICLDLGLGVKGFIGHTQPRRIAARTVANRIAEELKCNIGESVGFKVRFSDHVSPLTHIKLMTDGVLLAEIQSDRNLLSYEVLIIDEAHERSLNIDFILGYIKSILPKRPDLKVIITSATIDTEKFSQHFNGAPIIEVSGRTFPVEMLYRPLDESSEENSLVKSISDAIFELNRRAPGDTLVFLPGEREIREAAEYLRKHHPDDTEILPLFARLSVKDQEKIFKPHQRRRVVLATNVAETSLTVPGIRYVVDPGLARISRYSIRSRIQRLPIEPVSQAAANQRSGRCGRIEAGVCIRLYSEEDFNSRPPFTDPEILRVNLASVILQMLSLRFDDIHIFPFINPPERKHINDGVKLLYEIGAVDKDHKLIEEGRLISKLPIDPRLGKMLLQANREGCLSEVLIITAFLSIQDPRERPFEAQQKATELHARFKDEKSDFLAILNLWQYFQEQSKHLSQSKLRKLCGKEFIAYMRMREWRDIYIQLKNQALELGLKLNDKEPEYISLHRAILSGLLSNIGFKSENKEFIGAKQKKYFIFPGSHLFKKPPKWIVASEIVETGKNYARNVASIDPEWLVDLASHLLNRSYFEPHWQKNSGQVGAFEKISLFGLIIVQKNRVNYGPIDPKESREIFIRHALVYGEIKAPERFITKNLQAIKTIEEEESKFRRPDLLLPEEDIIEFFNNIIPDNIYSWKSFKPWYDKNKKDDPDFLVLTEEQLIRQSNQNDVEGSHPDKLQIDSFQFKLKYRFEPGVKDDGVTAIVPLSLLSQLKPYWFDWLVPGLIKEKITLLIKSLPKNVRKNFVPAPDFSQKVLESCKPYERPLLVTLSEKLNEFGPVKITALDFSLDKLPPYLFFNFALIDQEGKDIDQSRDISQLQNRYAKQSEKEFEELPLDQMEIEGIVDWSFGDLPDCKALESPMGSLTVYPALVDAKDSVILKYFPTEKEASSHLRAGMIRLIKLSLDNKTQYLQKNLAHIDKQCMYYSSIGQCNELKLDLIDFIINSVFLDGSKPIRNQRTFEKLLEEKQAVLLDVANRACNINLELLKTYNECKKKLKAVSDPQLLEALTDVQEQLQHLVYRKYLSDLDIDSLNSVPRYLKAIIRRLEKLRENVLADRKHMLEIKKYWAKYKKLKISHSDNTGDITKLRWMIEEYRVSLWAQELKTRYPISAKRLDEQFKKMS